MTKQLAIAVKKDDTIEDESTIDRYKKLDQDCNIVLEKIKTRKKRKAAKKAATNDE